MVPPHSLCFIVTLIAFGQLNRIFNASVGAIDKLLASHHLLLSATTMILCFLIFSSSVLISRWKWWLGTLW